MTAEQRKKKRERDKRYRENMTDERKLQIKQYQREYYQKWKLRRSAESAAHKKDYNRRYREKLKQEKEAAVIERRTGIRPETSKERRERYERENAEMRALGITYGKYQLLKSQGRLPKDIKVEPKPEHEKIPKQNGEKKKDCDYDTFRMHQLAIMAARAAEEARQKKEILQKSNSAVDRYMAAQKRYKELTQKQKERKEA